MLDKILIMESISDNKKERSFEYSFDLFRSSGQYLHSLASLRDRLSLWIKSFFEYADMYSLTLAPMLVADRRNYIDKTNSLAIKSSLYNSIDLREKASDFSKIKLSFFILKIPRKLIHNPKSIII